MSIDLSGEGTFQLPLRFFLVFRAALDDLHRELAEQGHPDVRPLHGFVLQAVGRGATTAAELGRRLGVTRQAAGAMVDRLQRLGYLERARDPRDGRKKGLQLTPRGRDCLVRSGAILARQRQRWEEELGAVRLAELERDLRVLAPGPALSLDVPGWFGGVERG